MNRSQRLGTPNSSNYTYQRSVGASELRLLEVVHISPENLCFRLRYESRNTAPPYTAVSYTWGNDVPSEFINIDGKSFHIRLNLWSCLYYLGLASQRENWKYLWVDAICIDQGNLSERNIQVRCMDQTYKDAALVSVWLGLKAIPDELKPLVSDRQPVRLVGSDAELYDSIHDLANRDYWSRYWVIQEFLLGNVVRLNCSNDSMDWEVFRDFLCEEAGILPFSHENEAVNPKVTASFAALPLLLSRHPDKHPDFLQPLGALLVAHSRSKCKDPRDRIFALLGLVSDDERRLLNRFFPDYTLSLYEVWTISLAHLMQCESLGDRNSQEITPDSEDIFRGLGVNSKPERRFLIDRAKEIDYFDDWEPGQFSHALQADLLAIHIGVNQDGDEVLGGSYEYLEYAQADQTYPGTAGWSKPLKVVAICLLLGVVGSYCFIQKSTTNAHSRL